MPRALPSAATLTFYDHGLRGVTGAQRVLAAVKSRDGNPLSRLDLGHNDLGDDGIKVLVEGLLQIQAEVGLCLYEISLMSNSIGNEGGRMVARLIDDIPSLTHVYLAFNDLSGEDAASVDELPDALKALLSSIGRSRLTNISLTNNRKLGPYAVKYLLACLEEASPRLLLQELHLNIVGATALVGEDIARYLSRSPNPPVRMLGLNANLLGLEGMSVIAHAIEKHNSSVVLLEMYANSSDEEEAEASRIRSTVTEALARNRSAATLVADASMKALRYGRVLLSPASLPMASREDTNGFPYARLPRELQIMIFQALVDPSNVLSNPQLQTLVSFSSDRSTLRTWSRFTTSFDPNSPTSETYTKGDRAEIVGDMRSDWQRRSDGTWTGKADVESIRYDFLRLWDCHVWRPHLPKRCDDCPHLGQLEG